MSLVKKTRAKDLLLETGMFGQDVLQVVGDLEERLLGGPAPVRDLHADLIFSLLLDRPISGFHVVSREHLSGWVQPEWMSVHQWTFYRRDPELAWVQLTLPLEAHFKDKPWIMDCSLKEAVRKAATIIDRHVSEQFSFAPQLVRTLLQKVATHYLSYAATGQTDNMLAPQLLLEYCVPFVPLGTLKGGDKGMLLYQLRQ
jgi:hypothetical protein